MAGCGRHNQQIIQETTMNTSTKASNKSGARSKPSKKLGPVTLSQLGERWLKHLDQIGKSRGTTFSYEMDFATAKEVLGADTPISSITAEQVQGFNESDAVMKTRKGRAKAKPTIEKTRR